MRLCFTGTQKGMTLEQRRVLREWLSENRAALSEIRHGGCIGADEQFHTILLEQGLLRLTFVYPSNIPGKVAKLPGFGYRTHPPADPLDRNRLMVALSDVVLATPRESEVVIRSGTWATIRRARKTGRQLVIIEPDGHVTD